MVSRVEPQRAKRNQLAVSSRQRAAIRTTDYKTASRAQQGYRQTASSEQLAARMQIPMNSKPKKANKLKTDRSKELTHPPGFSKFRFAYCLLLSAY